jgi:hypothetical protein
MGGPSLSQEEVDKVLNILCAAVDEPVSARPPVGLCGSWFDNNDALQKAMRWFSSYDLAKIIVHRPDMADCFRRNMNEVCWNIVEKELNGLTEEAPWQVFNRFLKAYADAESNKG